MSSRQTTRLSALAILLAPALLSTLPTAHADSLASIVQAWNLTAASFNFSMPNGIESSGQASSYIVNDWDTNNNHLDWGSNNVVFSPDPDTYPSQTLVRRQAASTSSTPTSSASRSKSTKSSNGDLATSSSPSETNLNGQPPVLRVEYANGTYNGATGGTQWTSAPFNGESLQSGYERMLLSYEVWFPEGYEFVQGGKLPGLRGGTDQSGCSGGIQPDGTDCFSTRIMWRTNGAGEVYAYIPKQVKNFCSDSNVICNSDYGTSLSRGSFTFQTGAWNQLWLLVVLNDPAKANGIVQLWHNGQQALSFSDINMRTADSLSSVSGMFFSTFFGGSDASWATPTTQYTYYKNFQLIAGYGQSNASGAAVSGGRAAVSIPGGQWGVLGAVAVGLLGTVVGLVL